jgi:leucyl/phenylalanyl-tRNA--protein transferase
MADPERGGAVGLYDVDPRTVIPLESFRVPRSVARAVRRAPYEIAVDRAFADVLAGCAAGREDGEWLSEELRRAYAELHELGFAHSVECWSRGRLVGGLFGIALGGLFTSESMFHRAPDAGSLAIVATAERLRAARFALWDIQTASPHTRRFGAREIPAAEYRRRLDAALALERSLVPARSLSRRPAERD